MASEEFKSLSKEQQKAIVSHVLQNGVDGEVVEGFKIVKKNSIEYKEPSFIGRMFAEAPDWFFLSIIALIGLAIMGLISGG